MPSHQLISDLYSINRSDPIHDTCGRRDNLTLLDPNCSKCTYLNMHDIQQSAWFLGKLWKTVFQGKKVPIKNTLVWKSTFSWNLGNESTTFQWNLEKTFLWKLLFLGNQTDGKYFSSQKTLFWDIFWETEHPETL